MEDPAFAGKGRGGRAYHKQEIKIMGLYAHSRCCMQSGFVAQLDLSLRESEGEWEGGGGEICRRGNPYVDGKLDRPYNSLRNYTQSHKCPPCVKCPACAHTPGPSRRPCLEFSRGFIGTTSINQVRECGDIILYYIMNYKQNSK